MLDLGAIGKGYAVERAAEVLREAGVTSALVHGGTSTVQALGTPPGEEFWKIAIETPSPVPDAPPTLLATVPLKEEAMSVSGVWGNSFQVGGRTFGHIIDPRTGEPAIGTVLAAVVLPSATETDALSTALLTVGAAGHDAIAGLRPGMRTLVVSESGGQLQRRSQGHRGAVGGRNWPRGPKARLKNPSAAATFTMRQYARGPLLYASPGVQSAAGRRRWCCWW